MKKKNRRIGCLLIALAIIISGSWFALNRVLPYSIIKVWRHSSNKNPADYGLSYENVAIRTLDSIDLKGWLIFPKNRDSVIITVIFCHGIGGNRSHFIESAKNLAEHGFQSLLLDGRAHGESGGEFCTYGFYEKNDEKQAVDYLKKRFPNQKIGIWGASLGGAIALQSLENDPRLAFGLIESTFTDLSTIVSDYQKQRFLGIRIRAASNYALEKAGEIANFDPQSVRPIESATHIHQPVLMIHGDNDHRISYQYGRQIYDSLATKSKDFITIHGADHSDVHTIGGQFLEDKTMEFIEKQLKNE